MVTFYAESPPLHDFEKVENKDLISFVLFQPHRLLHKNERSSKMLISLSLHFY
jgi:hypothetical protein